MAATWDTALIYRIGQAIALEASSKGKNVLLAPCVNILRFPLGGRNFESYGEDPFLTSGLAVSFIKGVQSQHVIACVKHYACNNQEWERHHINVEVGERALREIYLPAFKSAVQVGGAGSVMAAYNKFRGSYCSENDYLLTKILKDEWGFKGFVVSDWGATYHTIAAANAGLDLEMPYGEHFGDSLRMAVLAGDVSEQVIDDKVRRLLRALFESGAIDRAVQIDTSVIYRGEQRQLAHEAALNSIVLLKNERNMLPLNMNEIRTLALIGAGASESRTGGGGSSRVTPLYSISPLQALKDNLLDQIKILVSQGVAEDGDILPVETKYLRTDDGQRGLKGFYYKNTDFSGVPVLNRIDSTINFNWGYDGPDRAFHQSNDRNTFSVKWKGNVSPPVSGTYVFHSLNNYGIRVYVDNRLIIDRHEDKEEPEITSGEVKLESGRSYDILVEYYFNGGYSEVKLGWDIPGYHPVEEAVKTAKIADAVIVFAGLSDRFESEGFDRDHLNLPNQSILVSAVASANPNTVVVLQTGSPVNITSWDRLAPAILQAWYGGEEGGSAIAEVLLGKFNPCGKLPFSFITSKNDSPSFEDYKDTSLIADYKEGIYTGYRYLDKHHLPLLFPFGHGLSYTRFMYTDLSIKKTGKNEFAVSMEITNAGYVKGKQVLQLYVHPVNSGIDRPEKELKGFSKVEVPLGESRTVNFFLNGDAFSYYDEQKGQWVVEPGEYEILIGTSAREIRLMDKITVE
jgi:beta-glucosidase